MNFYKAFYLRMATVNNKLKKAIELFSENGLTNNISFDAKLLLSNIFGIGIEELYSKLNMDISDEDNRRFEFYLLERIKGKPVSKIINRKYFWDYSFYVDDNVLDPRPDSEILIEAITEDYNINDNLNIFDLGTGSGCLILTLLKIFSNSKGLAIDKSSKALDIARMNAKTLNINNIAFKLNNWNDNLNELFDIIVSNPPYIKTREIDNLQNEVKFYDPRLALDGGEDGLDCYRYLAKNLAKNLNKNGKIYLEICLGYSSDVIRIFEKYDFNIYKKKKDLQGIERVLVFYYADNI